MKYVEQQTDVCFLIADVKILFSYMRTLSLSKVYVCSVYGCLTLLITKL